MDQGRQIHGTDSHIHQLDQYAAVCVQNVKDTAYRQRPVGVRALVVPFVLALQTTEFLSLPPEVYRRTAL